MTRSAHLRLAITIAAVTTLAAAGAVAVANSALAQEDQPGPTSPPAKTAAPAVYFAASLNGRNEVPGAPGSPAVADPDGRAVQLMRIQGNQVSFAIKWHGISAPTTGHIRLGAKGANGTVQIPLFGATLPSSLSAAVGTVNVGNAALLKAITTNPGGFYANIHTADFPGGAVRGQFTKLTKPVDLNSVLRGGPLTTQLNAAQEVEPGDPNGSANAVLQASGNRVNFALHWAGISPPKDGDLHEGAAGKSGPPMVRLFTGTAPLPASLSGVAGAVYGVNGDVARRIAVQPAGFYVNINTADFTKGAVRGQLVQGGTDQPASFNTGTFVAAVVKGEQLYTCTQQANGSFAFTQSNVRAVLETEISHTFVKHAAGPPQWLSKDTSGVTGKLIAKTANGTTNIPELDLDATHIGSTVGQFAGTQEILRLNTIGGLAPGGTCDPTDQPTARTPYEADYVFLAR